MRWRIVNYEGADTRLNLENVSDIYRNETPQLTCVDCKIQYVDPDDREDDGTDFDTIRLWICAEKSKKSVHNFPCLPHFGVSIFITLGEWKGWKMSSLMQHVSRLEIQS